MSLPCQSRASSMSSVIFDPQSIEDLEQDPRADLVARVELEQLGDGGTALVEIAEPHLQIRVSLQGEEIEPRQDILVVTERGIAGRDVLPVGRKLVLARRLFQAELRDRQRVGQPALVEIE